MKSDPNDPRWDKTRALLKEHLTVPPLAHPDFINSPVLEAIRRDGKPRAAAPLFSLRGLAWSGAGALAAAVVRSVVLLPHRLQPRSEGEFISQVIEARAEIPQLSVTSFHAPGDRGVVLWIEGSDFIPSEEAVR